jgi:hypothetical protein
LDAGLETYTAIWQIFFHKPLTLGLISQKNLFLKLVHDFQEILTFQYYDSPDWETPKYDLIFASVVFHHIPHADHAVLIEKLSSPLNQSGRLVIWGHNPINPITQKIVKECIFDQDAILVPSTDIKTISVEPLSQKSRLSTPPSSLNFCLSSILWTPI